MAIEKKLSNEVKKNVSVYFLITVYFAVKDFDVKTTYESKDRPTSEEIIKRINHLQDDLRGEGIFGSKPQIWITNINIEVKQQIRTGGSSNQRR
jgi:hypothetical protein